MCQNHRRKLSVNDFLKMFIRQNMGGQGVNEQNPPQGHAGDTESPQHPHLAAAEADHKQRSGEQTGPDGMGVLGAHDCQIENTGKDQNKQMRKKETGGHITVLSPPDLLNQIDTADAAQGDQSHEAQKWSHLPNRNGAMMNGRYLISGCILP